MKKRFSIRMQLLSAFSAVIVLLLLIVSVFTGFRLKKISGNYFNKITANGLLSIGNSVKELFKQAGNMTELIVNQSDVQNADDSLYSLIPNEKSTTLNEPALNQQSRTIRNFFKTVKKVFPIMWKSTWERNGAVLFQIPTLRFRQVLIRVSVHGMKRL